MQEHRQHGLRILDLRWDFGVSEIVSCNPERKPYCIGIDVGIRFAYASPGPLQRLRISSTGTQEPLTIQSLRCCKQCTVAAVGVAAVLMLYISILHKAINYRLRVR